MQESTEDPRESVNAPSPLRPDTPGVTGPDPGAFKRGDLVLLAAITLAGAVLRLALAWGRPRLGDEVGTLINLRMDAGYLLTHFSGWLTMNYFILAEKWVAQLTGSEGWPLEIIPLLGAVATIPLTASLARRLGGRQVALLAAALTAFNPYLVQFSPVLRAYAPLAALAVWSVDRFYRWRERRTWAAGIAAAAVSFLLLLMHPNGIYVVVGLGLLWLIDAARLLLPPGTAGTRKAACAELATFAVPLGGAGLATWLAYHRLAPDVQIFSAKWGASPPTSLGYLPEIFATYFGRGFPLFLPGGLLVVGIWSATQTRQSLLPLCLLVGLSPILISLKGVSHFPWAYARFQIYCIPLMLILMAEGIQWLAERITPKRTLPFAWMLALLMILAWVPPLAAHFRGEHANAAYARTADYLLANRRAGDLIVAEGATQLQLTPLLPRGADGSVPAEDFIKKPAGLLAGQRVFFVAPGSPELGSSDARQDFGKLQVVVYGGPTAAILTNLRADLARVASGRVDPLLGDPYQLLALLDQGLTASPDTPSPREWRLLARLCRTQTDRFRWMPEQMRDRPDGPGKTRPAVPVEEPEP